MSDKSRKVVVYMVESPGQNPGKPEPTVHIPELHGPKETVDVQSIICKVYCEKRGLTITTQIVDCSREQDGLLALYQAAQNEDAAFPFGVIVVATEGVLYPAWPATPETLKADFEQFGVELIVA